MSNPHAGTYNVHQSYEWNFDHGPTWEGEIPKRPPTTKPVEVLGFKLNSPLGVPAGPLLNSKYIELYAKLGWDMPVYKTVRSVAQECHPAPNCIYVHPQGQLQPQDVGGKIVGDYVDPQTDEEVKRITITNSFGMPSKAPKVWMRDVEKANATLGPGQVMVVSVVGTPGEGDDLPADYAKTAALAMEAGAKIIEANFSCPNVVTGEGGIFQDPVLSVEISKAIRKEIGTTPFLIKVGNYPNTELLREILKANEPYIDGVSGINTIPMKVYNEAGEQALPGAGRLTSGLCGAGIHNVGLEFVQQVQAMRSELKSGFVLCGVGGITTPKQFQERLDAGADLVMSATGAMWDPLLAHKFQS